MKLRDFLETREREVSDEIAILHSQLVPLEAELAELRQAMASLGLSRIVEATGRAAGSLASPYSKLTMKELVIKALIEHFKEGANTKQLMVFFRDAWGREIRRENLSPQISRLNRDGIVERVSGTKLWRFVPEECRL